MTQLVPGKGSIDLEDYILINAGVVSGRRAATGVAVMMKKVLKTRYITTSP